MRQNSLKMNCGQPANSGAVFSTSTIACIGEMGVPRVNPASWSPTMTTMPTSPI